MKAVNWSGIAIAGAFGFAATLAPVQAQTPSAPGAPAQKAAPAETPVYGSQMMTPAERAEWRQKMAGAKTAAERDKLRSEHHAQMVRRAQENGVTLAGPRGEPRLYGQQLMTPEERAAHMEKMRAASTREERLRLRDEHRAEMQKRAQEKGITLPEPRLGGGPGQGGGPGMRGGGMGMGGGPGKGPGARSGQAPATTPSAPAGK